jgi:hypothetical protein
MKKNNIIFLISLLIIGLFSLISFVQAAGWIDEQQILKPNEYYNKFYSFGENTNPITFDIQSNASVDVYFLNNSAMGSFLTTGSLPTPNYANITNINAPWTVDYLHNQYHIDLLNASDGSNYTEFYIVVFNHGINSANVIVRLGYVPLNDFLDNFGTFLHIGSIIAFGFVSIKLLFFAHKYRKDKDFTKAKILQGYGLGIFLVFLEFVLADVRSYWEHEIGGLPNIYRVALNVPSNFPINYYDGYIATIILLAAGDFMFLCWIVEKEVKQRKIPIVSYNLILSGFLPLLIFVIPSAGLGLFIYFFISLSIAVVQIALVYLQVIGQNEGMVRRKALSVLLGIAIPMIAIVLRLFAHPPIGPIWDILLDSSMIFGMWLFYRGNIGEDK